MLLGFPPDHPDPPLEEWLQLVHPEDQARITQAFEQTIRTGLEFAEEYRVITADGTTRWIQAKGKLDGTAARERVHGIALDLTARKQMEQELRHTNAALEQFAYAAAHDLQEPLRNISLSLQLARRKKRVNEDGKADELMDIAIESAKRMEMMVKDLLAFSRALESGMVSQKTANAADAFARSLENLRLIIDESHALVSAGALPTVNMQEVHLV